MRYAILAALALVACGGGSEEKDGTSTDGATNELPPGYTEDTAPGTDDTSAPPLDPLVVAAIGWEVDAGFDAEAQLIEPYLYPDFNGTNGGAPFGFSPNVLVTLASIEYFGGGDPEVESCTFYAFFSGAASDYATEQFDYDSGRDSTGIAAPAYAIFEGTLTIIESSLSDRCDELDTDLFPTGEPMDLLDGMRFGVAYGPQTPYITEQLSSGFGADWATYENAILTQFIAINHPNDAGGVDFVGFDWNYGLFLETDYTECVYYPTTGGGSYDICGIIGADNAGYFLLGDATATPLHGVTLGASLWLEDTPNFDVTRLKEGL